MSRYSEAIWTVFVFTVLFVASVMAESEFPGSVTLFFMAVVAYVLMGALWDFLKVLDPDLRPYAITPIRRHILVLGAAAIILLGWSTFKVEPLPSGVKLDMEAVRTTARLVGMGVLTGLIAGGLIAAAQTRIEAMDETPNERAEES